MFTGIVTAVGKIEFIAEQGSGRRITVATGTLDICDATLGESIAVNGVCLTAVEWLIQGFIADVSSETLACTTLGKLAIGSPVNLERALRLADRLGGHLVSGHVDGIARVVQRFEEHQAVRLVFAVPAELARYISRKGSVCVDGTSLTVNSVNGMEFGVLLIPHTLAATIAAGYQTGTEVNLEVDMLARYVERLISATEPEL